MNRTFTLPPSGPTGGPGVMGPWTVTETNGLVRIRRGLAIVSVAGGAAVLAHCILPLI